MISLNVKTEIHGKCSNHIFQLYKHFCIDVGTTCDIDQSLFTAYDNAMLYDTASRRPTPRKTHTLAFYESVLRYGIATWWKHTPADIQQKISVLVKKMAHAVVGVRKFTPNACVYQLAELRSPNELVRCEGMLLVERALEEGHTAFSDFLLNTSAETLRRAASPLADFVDDRADLFPASAFRTAEFLSVNDAAAYWIDDSCVRFVTVTIECEREARSVYSGFHLVGATDGSVEQTGDFAGAAGCGYSFFVGDMYVASDSFALGVRGSSYDAELPTLTKALLEVPVVCSSAREKAARLGRVLPAGALRVLIIIEALSVLSRILASKPRDKDEADFLDALRHACNVCIMSVVTLGLCITSTLINLLMRVAGNRSS